MSRYPTASELPIVEPIDVPLEEFPLDAEVPEGCVELVDLKNPGTFYLDFRQHTYVLRTSRS